MNFSEIWLFLQQGVLSGLVTGSVYALLAIAIVAIFKTTDVPNFAASRSSTALAVASPPSAVVMRARSRDMRKKSFDCSGPVPTPTIDHCLSTCASTKARIQYDA